MRRSFVPPSLARGPATAHGRMTVLALMPALVLAATLVACSATTPVTLPTPGPTVPVSPSPSASKPPPTPRARTAVYQSGGALWLYDVAADQVRQLTQPAEGVRLPRWISADEISFVRDGAGGPEGSALMRVDLKTSQITELFRVDTGIATYGWSPDRATVGYVTVDELDFPQIHFRSLAGAGSIRTVATLARQVGREFVDDDQFRVEFSSDGQRVLIVYTAISPDEEVAPEETQLQVRTFDGSLAFAPPQSGAPTMGLWSPDGTVLYYRVHVGAKSWSVDGGRVRPVPGNPAWYHPSISRNGRLIAFDTGASQPGVRVGVVDLRRGSVSTIAGPGRAYPVFAANRVVWVQRVRRCSDDCFTPGEPVEEVYAVDVSTRKERRLAIRSLLDVDVRYA